MPDDVQVVVDDTLYSGDPPADTGEDLYVGDVPINDTAMNDGDTGAPSDDPFAEDIGTGIYDDTVLLDDGDAGLIEFIDWDFTLPGDGTDDLILWILPVEELPPDGTEPPAGDPAVCGIPLESPVCDRTLDAAVLYGDTAIL